MNAKTSLDNLRSFVLRGTDSTKEQGDRFEQATEMWLYSAPEFNTESRYTEQVSRWESFARTWNRTREDGLPALDVKDLGIDLVARMSDGSFIPVQCKGDRGNSGRDGVLKFRNAIERAEPSGITFERGIYAVLTGLSDHAVEEVLTDGYFRVNGVSMSSDVSYSDCLAENRASLRTVRLRAGAVPSSASILQPHQVEQIKAAMKKYAEGYARTQVISSCGSGKSIMTQGVAVAAKSELTLVVVPSLLLVQAMIETFRVQYGYEVNIVAICSESKVAKSDDISMGELVSSSGDAKVYSKPQSKEMSDHIASLSNGKPTVVLTTYASVGAVSVEQNAGRLREFDLLIADEAHHLVSKDKWVKKSYLASKQDAQSIVLDLSGMGVKAKLRLFVTATPKRIVNSYRYEDTSPGSDMFDVPSMGEADGRASIDFGPVANELWMGEAIKLRLLSPYLISVIIASDVDLVRASVDADSTELFPFSKKRYPNGERVLGTVRDHIAVRAVSEAFRKGDRRFIAFCSSVEDSKRFALIVEAVLGIPSEHLDGETPMKVREDAISKMSEPGAAKRGRLLTNCNVLGEGVDIPSLDAVVFNNNVQSAVKIIQNVGRGIRKHDGKKHGRIIVPQIISASDATFQDGEIVDGKQASRQLSGINSSSKKFAVVTTVLASMAEHDRDLWDSLEMTQKGDPDSDDDGSHLETDAGVIEWVHLTGDGESNPDSEGEASVIDTVEPPEEPLTPSLKRLGLQESLTFSRRIMNETIVATLEYQYSDGFRKATADHVRYLRVKEGYLGALSDMTPEEFRASGERFDEYMKIIRGDRG